MRSKFPLQIGLNRKDDGVKSSAAKSGEEKLSWAVGGVEGYGCVEENNLLGSVDYWVEAPAESPMGEESFEELGNSSGGVSDESNFFCANGEALSSFWSMKSYPHCPIYVLSKGRSDLDRAGTIRNLVRDLVPFTVVVEKEETEGYTRLLDNLVFQFFGDFVTSEEGGVGSASVDEGDDDQSMKNGEAEEKGGSKSEVKVESGTANGANGTQVAIYEAVSDERRMCFCCCSDSAKEENSFSEIISRAYHHGYVFAPLQRRSTVPENRSAAFTLHNIDEVRELFHVETLPESNKGVLYVRNYILHVLTPRLMTSIYMEGGTGSIEALDLLAPNMVQGVSETVLHRWNVQPCVFEALETKRRILAEKKKLFRVHPLVGYYWVLDDDIYSFVMTSKECGQNKRITPREMMIEVERRVLAMKKCAKPSSSPSFPSSGYVFTCKEEALVNNFVPSAGPTAGAIVTSDNFEHLASTAIISLEYSRFSYYDNYDDDAIAVNSYNTIACLFRYDLVHISTTNTPTYNVQYYPTNAHGVRSPKDTFIGYAGNMMWYRFAVREDYDFTLQLIARGMHTIRFRKLGFDVPQMSKLRGGMTDYYKNCQDEILLQNKRFVEQWPSISQRCFKGRNSSRREDIRIRWDLLHPSRVRYPGALLFLKALLPQIAPIRVHNEGPEPSMMKADQGTVTEKGKKKKEEEEEGEGGAAGKPRNHHPDQKKTLSSHEDGITRLPEENRGESPLGNRTDRAPQTIFLEETSKNGNGITPSSSLASSDSFDSDSSRNAVSAAISENTLSSHDLEGVGSSSKAEGAMDQAFNKVMNREEAGINKHENGKMKEVLTKPKKRERSTDTISHPRSPRHAKHQKEACSLLAGDALPPNVRRQTDGSDQRRSLSLSSSNSKSISSRLRDTDSRSSSYSSFSSAASSNTPYSSTSPVHHAIKHNMVTSSAPAPTTTSSGGVGQERKREDSNWKGFSVVAWREIRTFEAASLGLVHIPSSQLHAGSQVAVIPPDFSYSPSVMIATIIEKNTTVARMSGLCTTYPNQDEEVIIWTVSANKIRGIPLFTVVDCYEIPPESMMKDIISHVDAFFRKAIKNTGLTSSISSFLDN